MNTLYGWKGRVHKAIKIFEQNRMEYLRVCALPKTKDSMMKTINKTTCNHDADIALTWVLLESSRKNVDVTIDGYIASIRKSFDDYRRIQVEKAIEQQSTLGITPREEFMANNNDETDPNVTIWVEGVVENTINSHVKLIEQWREIISDARKDASTWRSEHEKYMNKIGVLDDDQIRANDDSSDDDSDSDELEEEEEDENDEDDDEVEDDRMRTNDESSDDDSDSDNSEEENEDESDNNDDDSVNQHGDNPFELFRLGTGVDEQTERLIELGTCVSAGKVLISSLKIAHKIESIEAAAQEAGTASILGLTQANLRGSETILSSLNHPIALAQTETDSRGCNRSENEIVKEWRQQIETTKVSAIYSWYRLYHGSLHCANTEQVI